MGRRRTFIESEVIGSATAVFAERGFAGASVDDLVRATGVNRASLYGVFGSKDGLFQRCLTGALAALSPAATPRDSADAAGAGREELDLILVALMEIAPGDPAVREALNVLQHRARKEPGLVADGRDMGTVVFPDAPLKVFLTASVQARAERRHKQLLEKGFSATLEKILHDLKERDHRDAGRTVAPLKPAEDAFWLDSGNLTVDETVDRVLAAWQERQKA